MTVDASGRVVLQIGKGPGNIQAVCPQTGDQAPGHKQGKHKFIGQHAQESPEKDRNPVARPSVVIRIAHAPLLPFCSSPVGLHFPARAHGLKPAASNENTLPPARRKKIRLLILLLNKIATAINTVAKGELTDAFAGTPVSSPEENLRPGFHAGLD
jgi:hypothetical protein